MDEETGLYYYGARYYDPKISMFYGVDPLAEKYSFQSPFAYAANSPIRFIDYLGLGPEEIKTLNAIAKQLNNRFNKIIEQANSDKHEWSAMITSFHWVRKNPVDGKYTSEKLYSLENIRTDKSIDYVSFDTDVNKVAQGKFHVHTDDDMPPSPGDILNLALDVEKEGFLSIVGSSSRNFALVIEDSKKAKKFLSDNKFSLQADMEMLYFDNVKNKQLPDNLAFREAIVEALKDSGIGFYETNNDKNEYVEVKSIYDE